MPTPTRLVAIDLDGTLFNSRQQITPRTLAALHAARAAGIEIAIATGRRHTFAWKMLPTGLLQDDDVILSSNGAVIRTRKGALLQRTCLARETSLAICNAAAEHRGRLVFTFDLVDDNRDADHHAGSLLMEPSVELRRIIERWIDDNRPDIIYHSPIESGLDRVDHRLPIQAMVCGSIAPMRDLETAIVSANLPVTTHRTEYAARDLCILDLLPAGCGKGQALAWLAARRGIAPGSVAAIGDNFNDAEMLALAGRAFVMGNSAKGLLALAANHGWRVVAGNEEDGAAEALEILAAGNLGTSQSIPSPVSERFTPVAR